MPHHRRASLAAALAMAAALLMACSFPLAAEAQPQPGRVRKELRRLSKQEVQMFVQAINVMQNTPTEVGQAQYGPAYKDWKYFIVKHAVAGSDPRGDQGHGAPCFMTFHRSFLLEVEAAVLSIVPDLKALPYWDITRDLRGGDISRYSRNYIFSSNWFGHLDGNPNEDYAVTDGLFPRTPVPTYTPPLGHEDTEPIYSGDTSTGRLRSDGNSNPRPYVTRMPVKGATDAYLGSPFHSLFFVSSPRPNELPLNYKAFDYWFCTDANIIQDWVDWSTCADVSTLYNSGASDDDVLNLIRTTRAPLLHPSPHWLVGGGLGDTAVGDFTDVVASTNEAALFLTHHTNIDRQNMIWQQNALNLDPSAAQRSWGFPATEDDYPNGWTGCYLNDVITSAFGFTDIFPGLAPSNPQGYTHADVLALTAPGVVTYSYDRMTPPAASKKGKGDEGKGQGKGGESKSKGEGEGKGKGRRSLREEEAAAAGGSFKWPKFYTPKHHRRQAQQAQA